jgi:hypothetical protein
MLLLCCILLINVVYSVHCLQKERAASGLQGRIFCALLAERAGCLRATRAHKQEHSNKRPLIEACICSVLHNNGSCRKTGCLRATRAACHASTHSRLLLLCCILLTNILTTVQHLQVEQAASGPKMSGLLPETNFGLLLLCCGI